MKEGKRGAQYVSENSMTEQLSSVFQQFQLPEDAVKEVSEALLADDEKTNRENRNKLAHVTAEIARYDAKIERNYDM